MNLAIAPWPTRDIEPSFLAADTGDSWPPQHVNPSDWNVPAPHIDSTTTVDQLLANIDAAHFPSLADRGKFAVEASSYWERAREQGQAARGGVGVVAGGVGGVGGGGLTGQVPRVGSSKLLNRWERDNCQMAYKTVSKSGGRGPAIWLGLSCDMLCDCWLWVDGCLCAGDAAEHHAGGDEGEPPGAPRRRQDASQR